MSTTARLEVEVAIKALPEKFFEIQCSKPQEICVASPDKVRSVDVVEGTFGKKGSVLNMCYVLDGEPKFAKYILEEVNIEKKKIIMKMIEGELMNAFKTFQLSFEVRPKDEGSIVHWILKYKKLHKDVLHPELLVQLLIDITNDIDRQISSQTEHQKIVTPVSRPKITHTDELDTFLEDMATEFSKTVSIGSQSTTQTQTQTTTHHSSSSSHVEQTCTHNSSLLSARDIVITFLQQDLTQLSNDNIPEHVVKAIQLLDEYLAKKTTTTCTQKTASTTLLSRIQTVLTSAVEVMQIIKTPKLIIERESELKKTLLSYIEEGNAIKATYATCVANAAKIKVKIKELEDELNELKKQLVSEEKLAEDLNLKRVSILEKATFTKTEWQSLSEKLEQVKTDISTKTCLSETYIRAWKEIGAEIALIQFC